MKLACVIVLYNPSDDNIQNIRLIEDYLDVIYVVDNSEDIVKRLINNKKIRYIKLGKNEGIAKALNIGAKLAIKDGFNWLLTLDQDSHITNEIINTMKNFILKNQNIFFGLISPYQDINSNEKIKDVEFEEQVEVMTSGNIINLNIYKKIGGFKDWLFIDCVDTDYCMNLNKNGYKVLRLNKLVMKHELGNLKIHTLFGKKYLCYNHNATRRYYIVRNTLYINKMYKNIYPEYCKHLIRIQKGQVKRIIVFENDKIKKLKFMLKGYLDYKKGITGKINK